MKFRSPVYSAVSGSIAGLTYSHNRGGMYARGRATPTNPNSTAQQAARMAMQTVVTRWGQVVTPAQRQAWANYASNTPLVDAFGEPLVLTGQQMYVRCNAARERAGLPLVDDGPTVAGLPTFTPVTLALNGGTGALELAYDNSDGWANEDDAGLIVQVGRSVGGAVNFFKGPFRFTDVVDGDSVTAPTSPLSVTTPFGQPVAGQRTFARARVSLADGRLSFSEIVNVLAT